MEKLARIAWNDNNWERPSGPVGKSTSKESYEYKTGFAHEEWLFAKREYKGYRYGFL